METVPYTGRAGGQISRREKSKRIEKKEDGQYIIKRELIVEEYISTQALEFQLQAIDTEIKNYQEKIKSCEAKKADILKMLSEIKG